MLEARARWWPSPPVLPRIFPKVSDGGRFWCLQCGEMARTPRYVPHGGALVEITYRTVQGRFLLRGVSVRVFGDGA